MNAKLKIGTRGSRLALWQAEYVRSHLHKIAAETEFEICVIKTLGDQVQNKAISQFEDKGPFSVEIENALIERRVDIAVHSLKDMPTELPAGLRIGAVLAREKPHEVLISSDFRSLDDLPAGARVASGSLRRRSQFLRYRPDLVAVEIRGNVPTRIEKLRSTDLDALILAFAGIHRLGLDENIAEHISSDVILPAAGQGAIAVEIREGDSEVSAIVSRINDVRTEQCVAAERSFVHSLEGGCKVPVGALADHTDDGILLRGFVGDINGIRVINDLLSGTADDPIGLGTELAEKMKRNGAFEILDHARAELRDTFIEVI